MITNVNSFPSIVQRIDYIRVSKSDRRIAKECMRNAESVAEIVCRAGANLRAAITFPSNALAQRAGSGIAGQR